MFRQILKLRQARRAFDDGRFEEALGLAEDPEIRDHLKARDLHRRSLEALSKRVADRADRGDLTRATVEAHRLAKHFSPDDDDELERELLAKKGHRDAGRDRARARFFKARLEHERGDLDAALATLMSIELSDRDDDTLQLMRDLELNRQEAESLLKDAMKRGPKEIATVEELLERASSLHPRAPGLQEAWLALAKSRVEVAVKGGLSDGALSSFLLEHGLFKRRHLQRLDGHLGQELDRPLNRWVAKRVKERMSKSQIEPAATLLERRRENLAGDEGLEELETAAKGLLGVERDLAEGDFDHAEKSLQFAAKKWGTLKVSKELRKKLDETKNAVEPALLEAQKSLESGDLVDAKAKLMDVFACSREHRLALRLLRGVHERMALRREKVANLQNLLDRRRLEDAADMLSVVRGEFGDGADLKLMVRELDWLEESAHHRRQDRKGGDKQPGPSRPNAGRPAKSLSAAHWMLSVEEHGEYLLLGDEQFTLGNEVSAAADFTLLANIASRHVEFSRKTSFHGGSKYEVQAIADSELYVNGEATIHRVLESGDRIRLGNELEIVFDMPCERSRAAVLRLSGTYLIQGAKAIILVPATGRGGGIVVGNRSDAHVVTDGHEGDLEIFRERVNAEQLVAQSPQGVALNDDEARSRVDIKADARLAAGELKVSLERR
ncbi:MAG: hypothetical protein V3W41_13485 [Planctomycetota bacterium]